MQSWEGRSPFRSFLSLHSSSLWASVSTLLAHDIITRKDSMPTYQSRRWVTIIHSHRAIELAWKYQKKPSSIGLLGCLHRSYDGHDIHWIISKGAQNFQSFRRIHWHSHLSIESHFHLSDFQTYAPTEYFLTGEFAKPKIYRNCLRMPIICEKCAETDAVHVQVYYQTWVKLSLIIRDHLLFFQVVEVSNWYFCLNPLSLSKLHQTVYCRSTE